MKKGAGMMDANYLPGFEHAWTLIEVWIRREIYDGRAGLSMNRSRLIGLLQAIVQTR